MIYGIAAARAAAELLENDGFNCVMAELKNDAFASWSRTAPQDKDAREDLYYMYIAIGMIETRLRAMADCATLEAHRENAAKQSAGA